MKLISLLSIEDNEHDSLQISNYLNEEFNTPTINYAKSFREANEILLLDTHYDVILLDLTLPDCKGEELVEKIVKLADSTPVIILTGYADRQFVVSTLSMGVSDYLFKDKLTSSQLFKSIVYSIERKKILVSLKENNELLNKLTNTVPIVIYQFEMTKDGKMTFPFISYGINRFTPSLNLEDLKQDATKIFERVHQDDIDPLLKSIEISRREVSDWNLEFRIVMEDGDVCWLNGVSHPERKESDTIVWYGFLEDITERKRSKALLEKQNEELQKTNEELDRFVYSASHDLRSPLASILGMVQIAESITDKAEMDDVLKRIKANVKRLDNFIQDILNYSKNSRTKVEFEKINWDSLVDDIINQLGFMVESAGIKISKEINQKVEFYGDQVRNKIILGNLMANAIKYQRVDEKEKMVSINVVVTPEEVTVVVEDNGTGIDFKYKDRIFEMFFRASKGVAGSGIGLYIVKEALAKLNGTIILETVVNKGSKFTVKIPNATK